MSTTALVAADVIRFASRLYARVPCEVTFCGLKPCEEQAMAREDESGIGRTMARVDAKRATD